MEKKKRWSKTQYEFREEMTTMDAVKNLANKVRTAKKAGEHALVMFLDLENAFNKTESKIILEELKRAKIETEIVKGIDWNSKRFHGRKKSKRELCLCRFCE